MIVAMGTKKVANIATAVNVTITGQPLRKSKQREAVASYVI
jgi:hypothetical protein